MRLWFAGTALLAMVVALWYVPAYMANGQVFVQKFLIEQNVGRFTGGDAAHTLPGIEGLVDGLVMYLAVILLGMLPWSLFIVSAWPRRAKALPRTGDLPAQDDVALRRYLATWATVVFIFFAISGAKLVHYLLPMFPPLAILVAHYAVARAKRPTRWLGWAGALCVFMSVSANGVFFWWFGAGGQAEAQAIARYVRREGGAVAIYQMGRRNKDMGTGKVKLQETSLPSLLMVLDSDALDTDDFQTILKAPAPIWIITREGRIQPADFIAAQRAGKQLAEVKPPVAERGFRLYRVREYRANPPLPHFPGSQNSA